MLCNVSKNTVSSQRNDGWEWPLFPPGSLHRMPVLVASVTEHEPLDHPVSTSLDWNEVFQDTTPRNMPNSRICVCATPLGYGPSIPLNSLSPTHNCIAYFDEAVHRSPFAGFDPPFAFRGADRSTLLPQFLFLQASCFVPTIGVH